MGKIGGYLPIGVTHGGTGSNWNVRIRNYLLSFLYWIALDYFLEEIYYHVGVFLCSV